MTGNLVGKGFKLNKITFAILLIVLYTNVLFNMKIFAVTDSDDKEYVVVLDPGHDSLHIGARGNGLLEEELNLKIAKFCQEYLEQYKGIKVYLTHNYLGCQYVEVEESSECNRLRAVFARNRNADLFVSIHINNIGSASVNGYELYYPNVNYKPELNTKGKEFVTCVGKQLSNLGIKRNKVMTRNSTDNEKIDENFYPDGSRADYYNVIRNPKYYGIPSVIVEHGYLSNRYDVTNFLDSDDKLEKLGKADAEAIAEYFGLVKKDE